MDLQTALHLLLGSLDDGIDFDNEDVGDGQR